MRAGGDAKPGDLCAARLHGFREARYIGLARFCCTLPCFLDDCGASLFAGDDGLYFPRPAAAAENDVRGCLSHFWKPLRGSPTDYAAVRQETIETTATYFSIRRPVWFLGYIPTCDAPFRCWRSCAEFHLSWPAHGAHRSEEHTS